ncbi:MAG: hypothetical protein QM729_20325 [Solirubrobacterales bacterium]
MGTARRSIGIAVLALLAAAAVSLAAAAGSVAPRPGGQAYFERVRDAVIAGMGRDFAEGAGVSGPEFQACLKSGMREALDPPTISDLAAVYRRPGGSAYAAQILNALALPLARACGHASWVPELTGAAAGLATSHATGAAVRRLGVTYGPYMGLRCRHRYRRGCDLVGIDLVFRRAATRVVAVVGSQRIHLRTPGMHDGVRHHDWVGSFRRRGILPKGNFGLDDEPYYVAVEVRVRFADGRRAEALFPHVLVSPGWG